MLCWNLLNTVRVPSLLHLLDNFLLIVLHWCIWLLTVQTETPVQPSGRPLLRRKNHWHGHSPRIPRHYSRHFRNESFSSYWKTLKLWSNSRNNFSASEEVTKQQFSLLGHLSRYCHSGPSPLNLKIPLESKRQIPFLVFPSILAVNKHILYFIHFSLLIEMTDFLNFSASNQCYKWYQPETWG